MVEEFDEPRHKTKKTKIALQLASSNLLQRYNKLSNQLRIQLIERYSRKTQECATKSQLPNMRIKARLAKKILEHEWGVKTL